jgi:hypothetical protein
MTLARRGFLSVVSSEQKTCTWNKDIKPTWYPKTQFENIIWSYHKFTYQNMVHSNKQETYNVSPTGWRGELCG